MHAKLTRARHTQQVSVNTRTDGVTEETMTLQPCCAERNHLLDVAENLGIHQFTTDSCRHNCWHNRKLHPDDPYPGRPRASRTTALFLINTECAKGVDFKNGRYDQTIKPVTERLQPMCSECYRVCTPKIKLARTKRSTPTVRDQIALWIRTKDLVELGNLYRLRMGIPLLQIKYKLTREQATVLHNTRSAKRALQNGNIDEALAGLRRIEHELIGNA